MKLLNEDIVVAVNEVGSFRDFHYRSCQGFHTYYFETFPQIFFCVGRSDVVEQNTCRRIFIVTSSNELSQNRGFYKMDLFAKNAH